MVVKLIFHGREEKMPKKKDPNWVIVRVEKIQIGKARDCPLSHYYLVHFVVRFPPLQQILLPNTL